MKKKPTPKAPSQATKGKQPATPSGLYVYALIDPRDGDPFYIGKGHGRRMFQHARNVTCGRERNAAKAARINSIISGGGEIGYLVLGRYETDEEAFAAEREFISQYVNLTNATAGGDGGCIGGAMEAFRTNSKRILRRMLPFDVWNATMPSVGREIAVRMYGSVENCYQQIKAGLISDIESPAPNTLTISGGKAVLGWER